MFSDTYCFIKMNATLYVKECHPPGVIIFHQLEKKYIFSWHQCSRIAFHYVTQMIEEKPFPQTNPCGIVFNLIFLHSWPARVLCDELIEISYVNKQKNYSTRKLQKHKTKKFLVKYLANLSTF